MRSELEAKAGADVQSTLVDTGHSIPDDAPQSIIDAIRGLLGAAGG